ncbi:hypothetical protein SJS46_14875 [Aeromonas caviae]|uniref:hypothetical protein n=2 Tax=Aeromonas caviae TaxID=648 RepID=UPI0029DB1319|nr:hypothetical protein [Aeromonas caviae]MDX7734424.1 hypothetical protein [Aeromonas caviae]
MAHTNTHGARLYLVNIWDSISNDDIHKCNTPQLTPLQAAELERVLKQDAEMYYYNGFVSICDAINGSINKSWSWSVIKLYYSIFFLCRSILAINGYAVCYLGKSEKWIKSENTQNLKIFPKKRTISFDPSHDKKILAGTHGAVLYLFEDVMKNNVLLSQDIDGLYPTEWMLRERETANYRECYFKDPLPMDSMKKINQAGVLSLLNIYMSDINFTYAFDKDHAIFSYPIELLKSAHTELSNKHGSQFIINGAVERSQFIVDMFGLNENHYALMAPYFR